MTATQIIAALEASPIDFTTEAELQRAIQAILVLNRAQFSREVRLSATERIDFLMADGLGIEIKIKGSLADVTRQLHRYAQIPEITGLLLVTTKARHLEAPRSLNGKPIDIYFVSLRRAF